MIQKLAIGVVASTWFSFVFLVGLWLTFPSGAAVERARYEVQERSEGSMAIDMDSLSPWWTGAKATNVVLASIDKNKLERGDEDAVTVLLAAEHARVRAGLFSLIGGSPWLTGSVGYGAGELDFEAQIVTNDRGKQKLGDLSVKAGDFPLSSLPPMGGVTLQGTGSLDLGVEVDASEGMRKANGEATLYGRDLTIDKIVAPSQPMLEGFDMVVEISELDLMFEIIEGRAKLKTGKVGSNLFDAELSGEAILMEDITRTRLRLEAVLTLGDELSMFKGLLRDAAHKDGTHHYLISGTLGSPRFMADRESTGSSTRQRTPNTRRPSTRRGSNNDDRDNSDSMSTDRPAPTREPGTIKAVAPRTLDDRGIARPGQMPKIPTRPQPTYVDPDDEEDTDEPLDDDEEYEDDDMVEVELAD